MSQLVNASEKKNCMQKCIAYFSNPIWLVDMIESNPMNFLTKLWLKYLDNVPAFNWASELIL